MVNVFRLFHLQNPSLRADESYFLNAGHKNAETALRKFTCYINPDGNVYFSCLVFCNASILPCVFECHVDDS